jgi:hypothetical protein
LKQKLLPDDPNIDEENPKFVLKCCRIFQPKYEDISSKDDGIDEEDKLLQYSSSKNELPKADFFFQWAKRKSGKIL